MTRRKTRTGRHHSSNHLLTLKHTNTRRWWCGASRGCIAVCTRQKTRTSTAQELHTHTHSHQTHTRHTRHTHDHTHFGANFFSRRLVSHGNAAGNPRRVGARHGERAPALTALLCCDENGSSARLGLRETARRQEKPIELNPSLTATHLRRVLPVEALEGFFRVPDGTLCPGIRGISPGLTPPHPSPRQRIPPVGADPLLGGWEEAAR